MSAIFLRDPPRYTHAYFVDVRSWIVRKIFGPSPDHVVEFRGGEPIFVSMVGKPKRHKSLKIGRYTFYNVRPTGLVQGTYAEYEYEYFSD